MECFVLCVQILHSTLVCVCQFYTYFYTNSTKYIHHIIKRADDGTICILICTYYGTTKLMWANKTFHKFVPLL